MKKENQNKKAILWLIGIFFLIPIISADYIGISPAKVSFENVLRSGYSEKIIIITTDSKEEVEVETQSRGEASEWINVSSSKFKVSNQKPYSLIVSVIPPQDTPNGNYTAFLRFKTTPSGELKEGYATGVIQTVLDLSINIEITDLEILSCSATSFQISSAEKGDPIILEAEVNNQGNTKIRPTIKVDIWDQEQMKIIKTETFSDTEVIPTTKRIITQKISSEDLEIGQYWAEISILDCYVSNTLTFDILEIGALKSSGELTKILTPPWSNAGETMLIRAYFTNTGEKRVSAQFKGTIILNGKIVELIESEEREVKLNTEEIFDFYFTPRNQGRYILTGRIFYDKKRTFEKSVIFNVAKKGISFMEILTYILYILTIIGIVILIYKIRKEREKIQNKLRRMG